MNSFEELGLSQPLLKAIDELGYVEPMPVQQEVIPHLLANNGDLVALAQTGTGKTAAFGLPILCHIAVGKIVSGDTPAPQAVVLCPTRELCLQIANDLNDYAKYMDGVRIQPVYGGSSIQSQIRSLKRGVHIIVATPGRLIDLMERNVARLDTVRYVIMDEADEMLNMGFTDSINTILAGVPEGRQTLLFSATMSKEIARIAKKYLHNAHEIVIGTKNEGTANVQHTYYLVHAKDKYPALKRIADYYPEIYGIIFCRTRAETQEIADKLIRDGYSAEALHGDLSQQQRDLTMQKFRTRATQLLVATDVAARGIDVENLTHIVNYGLPDDIESYTHRSGRTGRAGRTGISIAIANLREKGKIRRIEQIINKRFTESALPTGKQICEKQLLRVIDELEKVKVNEEEIATYLPTIYRKLDWLDKEDLIKRMVSSTFNRFLDYYAQAEDLERPIGTNASQGQDRFERGKGRRNERQSRGFGDSGQTRERGWRRVAADNLPDGRRQTARVANTRRAAEPGFTRVFINVGKRDGFRPQHLIEMINHHCRKRIEIGRIDLNRDFSFFEVDERQAKKVITALAKDEFNGRPLQLDVAE